MRQMGYANGIYNTLRTSFNVTLSEERFSPCVGHTLGLINQTQGPTFYIFAQIYPPCDLYVT